MTTIELTKREVEALRVLLKDDLIDSWPDGSLLNIRWKLENAAEQADKPYEPEEDINLEKDGPIVIFEEEEIECPKCGHRQLNTAGEYCKQCDTNLMEEEEPIEGGRES